jgi:hypothetical protein
MGNYMTDNPSNLGNYVTADSWIAGAHQNRIENSATSSASVQNLRRRAGSLGTAFVDAFASVIPEWLTVSADGVGVVSHAGSRLLADPSTLTAELSGVFAGLVTPQTSHDRAGCWSIWR